MSNVKIMSDHELAGSWNGGKYSVVVTRQTGAYRHGRLQYSYHASILRSSDGAVVNVSLATLRDAKISQPGFKAFPDHKFAKWQKSAKMRGDSGTASPILVQNSKAADVMSIDTDCNKIAKVTINIQKVFEGDVDEVRDDLYDLISQLEDTISDIEG